MRKTQILFFLCPLLGAICFSLQAQDGNSKAAIERKLESEFTLTKTTADLTDIVTPGCVLVLKKDNLVTVPINSQNYSQNTYKNGRISQGAMGRFLNAKIPGGPAGPIAGGNRTFVSGEKIWLTNIAVREKDIVFSLYTDAFGDTRYKASLSFPFPKGSTPSVDQVDETIAEVFAIQAADNAAPQQEPASLKQVAPGGGWPGNAPTGTAPPSHEAAPAPIAPPPPPADAPPPNPKTIELGQSSEEVVAILGKPEKIVKLASKQLYYYKDLKITFVNGKVSDVQ